MTYIYVFICLKDVECIWDGFERLEQALKDFYRYGVYCDHGGGEWSRVNARDLKDEVKLKLTMKDFHCTEDSRLAETYYTTIEKGLPGRQWFTACGAM